jgi:hypothetical protein
LRFRLPLAFGQLEMQPHPDVSKREIKGGRSEWHLIDLSLRHHRVSIRFWASA